MIWFWGLLFSYWTLFLLFKAPDLGDPDRYSMQGNIASYIDRLLLPWYLCCFEYGENEGLLALIPAIGTGLLGLLTGELLITDRKPMHKVLWMTVGGILLMIVGKLWNFAFPINKILWSSPFVC